jgi:hyaluronan synthase
MAAQKKQQNIEEVFPVMSSDRRVLPNVPDKSNLRTNHDRRGSKYSAYDYSQYSRSVKEPYSVGTRYVTEYDVDIARSRQGTLFGSTRYVGLSVNVSGSGMLVRFSAICSPSRLGRSARSGLRLPGQHAGRFESKSK